MDLLQTKNEQNLAVVGASEWVDVGKYTHIPAKTDTGAQSSAIWASHIVMEPDGTLKFRLFDEGSPYYTGRVFVRKPGEYKVGVMRSSNGGEQIRYRVYLPLKIGGRKLRVLFSLANREANNFPILVGRRTLSGKFMVNPGVQNVKKYEIDTRNPKTGPLSQELAKNPYAFHQKYVITKGERS